MSTILDSSAVLASLFQEPGQDLVAAALAEGAGLCTANLAEVMTRLVRAGMPPADAAQVVAELPVTVFDLDTDLAVRAGAMFALTRPFGLSLADRCCLALALREQAPVLTAGRAWEPAGAAVGASVRLIR